MDIINHRDNLPVLLRMMGLNSEGVEVGVAGGAYSSAILLNSGLRLLYSVDKWDDPRVKAVATELLGAFGDRNRMLHMTSEEASRRFPDNSLDFVYVDADHVYESVRKDLTLWYPKVKVGGVFAGHDYAERRCKYGVYGVVLAVDEMARRHGQRLLTTKERWPSWYLIKR